MTKKVTKVTKKTTEPSVEAIDTNQEILDRLSKVEARQTVIISGLRWCGNAIKPIFGIGGIGAYFCEIADKADRA